MLESHQFCEGKTEKGKGNESAGAREEPQAAILSQAIRALGKQWKVKESVSGEKGMTSARTQGRAGVCLLCSANSKDVMRRRGEVREAGSHRQPPRGAKRPAQGHTEGQWFGQGSHIFSPKSMAVSSTRLAPGVQKKQVKPGPKQWR